MHKHKHSGYIGWLTYGAPQLVLGRLMQSWVTAALLGALRSLGDALLTHLGTTPSSFTLSPLALHPSNVLGQLPYTRHTPSASCPTQAIQNTFPDERQTNSSSVPHTPTQKQEVQISNWKLYKPKHIQGLSSSPSK